MHNNIMDQEKFYRLVNKISGFSSSAIVVNNELNQVLVRSGEIPYQTQYGYLTDIFAAPCLMGLLISLYPKENIPGYGPASIAATYSIMEAAGMCGRFDPYDVLSYWVGAGLAYGAIKLGKSKKAKDFFNKLNPFAKKDLEELVKE